MHKLKETTSDDVKRQIAALLTESIEDLTKRNFADIEKAVNLLANKHFNGANELLWEIFWLHHASSEILPDNKNYHEEAREFYLFWQKLSHDTTNGLPNDIALAAITMAQRGYDLVLPFLASHKALGEIINIRDGAGDPLAHIAIKHNHPAFVKALHHLIKMIIRRTKLPPDNNGMTVLHCAVLQGQTDLAQYIWSKQLCERSAICQQGSALHIAITQHNEPLIILFSDTLSHVNTFSGKSPLHTAVTAQNLFAIDHLLSGQHCSVHAINTMTGNNALDDAIAAACNRSNVLPVSRWLLVVARLLDYGANINHANGQGLTTFEYLVDQLFHFPESERIQATIKFVMQRDQLISPATCQRTRELYRDRFGLVEEVLPEFHRQLTTIAARHIEAPLTEPDK